MEAGNCIYLSNENDIQNVTPKRLGWFYACFFPEDSTNNLKDDFYNIREKQGISYDDQILISPNLKSSLLPGGIDPIFNRINEKEFKVLCRLNLKKNGIFINTKIQ